jgi:GNAT superfamily N-acetyltransferase
MALATWWNTDTLPHLPPLSGLHTAVAFDNRALAQLNHIPITEVFARRRAGHRPYVASLHGTPVAYGWVAARVASIGELNLTIRLPRRDRYLWDFATLPEWQGHGIYPRLLQAILQEESRVAERFWIIYAPENTPSGAGMRKAGFSHVAALSFDADYNVRLAPIGALDRARAAAELLGVPLVADPLAPCWCCQGSAADCWPPHSSVVAECTCAIERRLTQMAA